MVCIYCGSKTSVTNSRKSAGGLTTWRRRACLSCNSVTTSKEVYDLHQAIRVQNTSGELSPLQRDRIFLDVYQSISHRKTALSDARELTDTMLNSLVTHNHRGLVKTKQIVEIISQTLQHFDTASYSYYTARH